MYAPPSFLRTGERVGEQVHLARHHGVDAGGAQRRLQGAVVGQLIRIEALRPDDGAGSGLAGEGGDQVHRVAALDQEA